MKILLVVILGLALFKVLFIFLEQKNLYHPRKDLPDTPGRLGIAAEDVEFKTEDDEALDGWFVPVEGAKVTVLYCHGNAGNIYDRLHKVKFFHEAGMNFFLFDYRGFGASTGTPSEKGLYRDARAAYDYLISREDVDNEKIVVYGKSLGGPVAADLCLHRKAAALVLEGSFASVTLRARQKVPFLPMKFLVTQKFDAASRVGAINVPKLIVHGRHDEVIVPEHGEILFRAAAAPKEFLPFDGGHNDDVYVTSDVYRRELARFLTEHSVL